PERDDLVHEVHLCLAASYEVLRILKVGELSNCPREPQGPGCDLPALPDLRIVLAQPFNDLSIPTSFDKMNMRIQGFRTFRPGLDGLRHQALYHRNSGFGCPCHSFGPGGLRHQALCRYNHNAYPWLLLKNFPCWSQEGFIHVPNEPDHKLWRADICGGP